MHRCARGGDGESLARDRGIVAVEVDVDVGADSYGTALGIVLLLPAAHLSQLDVPLSETLTLRQCQRGRGGASTRVERGAAGEEGGVG